MSSQRAMRARPAWSWRAIDDWVGTRVSVAVLFVVSLGVYALQSLATPLHAGRDYGSYVLYFLQLWRAHPLLPDLVTARGPLAPIAIGVPLEVGGEATEIWMALLYAASVVAWAAVAYRFGPRAALLTSVLLLLYPGYGILFHQLGSDSIFAAAFAGWAVLLARGVLRPSPWAFAAVGLGVGVLALVRPSNQVLLVFAPFLLLVPGSWRERMAWIAAFVGSAVVVIDGWELVNYLRYGEAVAPGPSKLLAVVALALSPFLLRAGWRAPAAGVVGLLVVAALVLESPKLQHPLRNWDTIAQLPSGQALFFRAFAVDRIVAPQNGPASRELARTVQRRLLTQEPYRSYGVDLHEFFSSGSLRMLADLYALQGRAPVNLQSAALEAIRKHPGTFARGVAGTLWSEFWTLRIWAPVPAGGGPGAPSGGTGSGGGSSAVVRNGRTLPRPSEGEPIPGSRYQFLALPHGGAHLVWTSATERHLVFDDPRDRRSYDSFASDGARLQARLSHHDRSLDLAHRLNQASRWFPPPAFWLVLGLLALLVRRPERALVALGPALAGVIVVLATALLIDAVPEYIVPVSPAFLLLAAAGLVGEPSARSLLGRPVPSGRAR